MQTRETDAESARAALRAALARAGMEMRQLSLRLGKNHAYIQQYLERGVPRRLRLEDAIEIGRILGIDYRDLVPAADSARLPGAVGEIEERARSEPVDEVVRRLRDEARQSGGGSEIAGLVADWLDGRETVADSLVAELQPTRGRPEGSAAAAPVADNLDEAALRKVIERAVKAIRDGIAPDLSPSEVADEMIDYYREIAFAPGPEPPSDPEIDRTLKLVWSSRAKR